MVGIRRAQVAGLVIALVAAGAGCGGSSDHEVRGDRLCRRIERYGWRPDGIGYGDDHEALAREGVLVRVAPYDIADEVAVVAASHRALVEGTPAVVGPERLAAAQDELEQWIETHCPPPTPPS